MEIQTSSLQMLGHNKGYANPDSSVKLGKIQYIFYM